MEFLNEIGRRFRNIGYVLLGILILTGVIQAIHHGATIENVLDGSFFQTTFGSRFGKKMLFFISMLAVSIAHDFFLGPATIRATAGRTGHRTAAQSGELACTDNGIVGLGRRLLRCFDGALMDASNCANG